MADKRIERYREAAEEMARGRYDVTVPVEGRDDPVDQLGRSLGKLGDAIAHRFEEMRSLAAITQRVNAGLLLDEVLEFVYETFRPIIPYERIGFSLIDDDGQMVRARWARSEAPIMEITAGYAAPLKGSSLEDIIETGEPRILNDLEAYLAAKPESDATQRIVREGFRSSLTCPLVAMGRKIGFMFFSSMQKNTYRDLHVEIFQQLAGQLSVIVEKGRLYQQLLELNELKNRFLGIAAHDLRSPLVVIQGYTDMLRAGQLGPVTDQQVKALDAVTRSAKTMINMVETLLDVSAIEAGQLRLRPVPVALAPYLAEVEASGTMLGSAKSIRFQVSLDPVLDAWVFDPYRIRQVLDNLRSNAFKFSEPGTTVNLRVCRDKDVLAMSMEDQGQGIPAAEIPRLFADFAQTSVKPTAGEQSTGLGLAICKRIVEAHGGTISVESTEGKGSVFTLRIP